MSSPHSCTSQQSTKQYYTHICLGPSPLQKPKCGCTNANLHYNFLPLCLPVLSRCTQAWDIFSHMCYITHPTPDTILYTQMIHTYANPVLIQFSSKPEKALNLWSKMTVDHKIPPTVQAYNAVILACVRSSTKTYMNEAFQLARQMRGVFWWLGQIKRHFVHHWRAPRGSGIWGRWDGYWWKWWDVERREGTQIRWMRRLMTKCQWISSTCMLHTHCHIYGLWLGPTSQRQWRWVILSRIQYHKGHSWCCRWGAPSWFDFFARPESFPRRQKLKSSFLTQTATELHWCHLRGQISIQHDSVRPKQHGFHCYSGQPPYLLLTKCSGMWSWNLKLLGVYLSVFYRHVTLATARTLFWNVFKDLGLERISRIYVETLESCWNACKGAWNGKLLGSQMSCGRSGRLLRRTCVLLGNRYVPKQ